MQLVSDKIHTNRPGQVGIDGGFNEISDVIRLAAVAHIRRGILDLAMSSGEYVLVFRVPVWWVSVEGRTGQDRAGLGDLVLPSDREPQGEGGRAPEWHRRCQVPFPVHPMDPSQSRLE